MKNSRLVSGMLLCILFFIVYCSSAQTPCANFGTNGVATSLESRSTSLNAVVQLSSGKIIAVGTFQNTSDKDFLVVRYNADGTPDQTFGLNGIRIYKVSDHENDEALAVAIAKDGNLLIGGVAGGYGTIIKINSNGALVSAFGTSGKVQYSIIYSTIEDILVSADGNIYAVGKTFDTQNTVIRKLKVQAYTPTGSPLTSFGEDGQYVDNEFLIWHTSFVRGALQSDGKIVVGGTTFGPNVSIDMWSLLRLNTDGTVDTSFGDNGLAEDPESSKSYVRDIAVDGNGSIYVSGFSSESDVQPSFAVVKKYKPDGDPDHSFNMNGSAIHTLSGQGARANAIRVDGTGKVFFVGATGAEQDAKSLLLAAYSADGNTDMNFGAHTDEIPETTHGELVDLMLLSDGSFLACGYGVGADQTYGILRKYNSAGAIDQTFNNGGARLIRFTEDGSADRVAVQSDSKVVSAGTYLVASSNTGFVIARFNTDGSPDATFGTYGYVRMDLNSRREYVRDVVVLDNGKILVAGIINQGNTNNDYVVVRLNADGSIDDTFANDGVFAKHYGAYGENNELRNITIDKQGRILLAADANYNGGSYVNATLMRLLPDGDIDTSFGDSGVFTINLTVVNDYFNDVAVAEDGSIYAAGNGTINFGAAVVKVTDAGELDTNFGTAGVVSIPWTDNDEHNTRAQHILVQSDGKILVGCTHYPKTSIFQNRGFLFRILPTGAVDDTFGQAGYVKPGLTAPSGGSDDFEGMLIANDNSIWISGVYSEAGNAFFLAKVGPDGSLLEEGFKTKDFVTGSNLAINRITGSLYTGVVFKNSGGSSVVCLGPGGGNGGGTDCVGPDPTITQQGDVLIASDADSYQWYKSGDAIDGETNQTLVINPVNGGSYSVSVTVGECTYSSDDFVYLVTDAEQSMGDRVSVYPNPVRRDLHIIFEKGIPAAMTVYSAHGSPMRTSITTDGSKQIIPFDQFPAGLYFLQVESPKGKQIFKLIKQN